jgi:putative methyltransferase (TIGR04325 family)
VKLSGVVKKVVPPLIWEAIIRAKAHSLPEFSSWDEALKKSTERAYEHNKLTKLIYEKTKAYRDNLSSNIISINNSEIQTLTALGIALSSQRQSKKLTVIDFGGACGAHFFLAKTIFDTIEFDWRVVETFGMVKYARDLESNELRFYSDIEEAIANTDLIHLVHSSGTLQCISKPYSVLQRLVNIKANYMLLSRLGVTPEPAEIITIHRHMMSEDGPGSAPEDFKDEICIYPFQYPVRDKINNILSEGYDIEFICDDPSGRFSVGSHEIIGLSYFLKKKFDGIKV